MNKDPSYTAAPRSKPGMGIRKSGRLHRLHAVLEQSEWRAFREYLALDRLPISGFCSRAIRQYLADCRAFYALGP